MKKENTIIIYYFEKYGLYCLFYLFILIFSMLGWKVSMASNLSMNSSVLVDPYASNDALRQELSRIYEHSANKNFQKTLQLIQEEGFSCTKKRGRSQHIHWCELRGEYSIDLGERKFSMPFLREIGLTENEDGMVVTIGYVLTDPNSNDNQVDAELKRIYEQEGKYDIKFLVNYLEREGFSCSRLEDGVTWCDYNRPLPAVFPDDIRFFIGFRRQISLVEKEGNLLISVSSHFRGL